MNRRSDRRARRKIFLIAPHFAEYTLRLALGIKSSRPDVDVRVAFDRKNFHDEVDGELGRAARDLPTTFFWTQRRWQRILAAARVVLDALVLRPDIVHIQESGNLLTIYIAPLLKFICPVVLTIHDPTPHMGRDAAFAARRWRRRVEVRRRADLVLGHGQTCTSLLYTEAAGALTAVGATTHGVILVPEKAERREPVDNRVLCFGRMEKYKGLATLVEAAEILNARGVPFSLVVAGRGPELDTLKPTLQRMSNVEVCDTWLLPAEVRRQFQQADLVVLPYLEATQSGVAAAAFANGRPIIASRVGGLVDVIQDGVNGVLAPPGDPVALADQMQAMFADQATRNRMAAAAAKTGETVLNWESIATDLVETYERVIAR